ncbi:MAG: phage BR0599 family protein [Agarilytica sp.]
MHDDGYLIEISGRNEYFRYTSLDERIQRNGIWFESVPLEINAGIKVSSVIDNADWSFSITGNAEVARLWLTGVPDFIVNIIVYRYDRAEDSWPLEWSGSVVAPYWEEDRIEFRCESDFTALRTQGLRRMYQSGCSHPLYGSNCSINRAVFRESYVASSVSGSTIGFNSENFSPGHFAGGYAEWTAPITGATVTKPIRNNGAIDITLSVLANDLTPGAIVNLYPGCDRSLITCADKFNNSINYGGQPWLSSVNPHTDRVF